MVLYIKRPRLKQERIGRFIPSANTTSPSEVLNVLFENVHMLGFSSLHFSIQWLNIYYQDKGMLNNQTGALSDKYQFPSFQA